MKSKWKEIFIESTETQVTKVSPMETVYSQTNKQKKEPKNKLIYFLLIIWIAYQIFVAYLTKIFYSEYQINTKYAEKYLDILEDTISSDMSRILQDTKRYWDILKLVNIKNSHKLDKIYFSQTETYLYFAVFQIINRELYSRSEFFNYKLLGNSRIPFEEFSEKMEGIEIGLLSSSRDGMPYLYNLTEKQDKTEIGIAIIPLEKQILALGFELKKWNELLAKRETGSYILLNHQGIVLAHSSPELVKNAVDYSYFPYFDFIYKDGKFYRKKEFISKSGNLVKVFVRKLIPFESYLVYFLEIEQGGEQKFLFFIGLSLLGVLIIFGFLFFYNK
ncbi:MAG: hypothetical protein N3A69_14595 [Leptospiraceae bacterium]|nr:hypothetical protein [Leptospiraceae bacterium]